VRRGEEPPSWTPTRDRFFLPTWCLSQVHELDSRHSAEAMKAEKWQFEYRNLHDKYEALVKEKEVNALVCPHLSISHLSIHPSFIHLSILL